MRIGSVSGIAGRGDSSLIRPVPDAETLPFTIYTRKRSLTVASFKFSLSQTLRQPSRRTYGNPNPSSGIQHYSIWLYDSENNV